MFSYHYQWLHAWLQSKLDLVKQKQEQSAPPARQRFSREDDLNTTKGSW